MSAESVPTDLVADKYRLTRMLGRGGMGSVWEGIHATLGTRVAVKFIEAEYANSTEARSRFENEARAAAKLKSKHVVKVHDHGLGRDGRPYIVMEFLDGEPLDRRLDRVGRLSPADTARILVQVCRALTNAHSVGIVHRDLKPENVFLVWDAEDQADVVKVVDFGIAKFTDTGGGLSSATRTGSVLGTPYYMSPEQARGLRTVDYRSDLWSLGVIAFRCVVGRLPFDGEAIGDLLVKICTSPLPVPSQVSPDVSPTFDTWFAKALQREPEARFQSAAELADALLVACGTSRGTAGSIAEGTIPSQAGVHLSNATPGGPPWPQAGGSPAHTASPVTVSVKSPPKGVLVAAVVGTLAVLAVGGVIAVKWIGGGAARAPASAPSELAGVAAAPPPSAARPAAPEVAPAVAPVTPVPSAAPSAEEPASKPVAATPHAGTHPPPPVVPRPPKPPPAGTTKPPKDRPIDVGY